MPAAATLAQGRCRGGGGVHALPAVRDATRTVFGEGPGPRAIMLVGEQPGDQEDSPGSRSSDRPAGCSPRLDEAGLDRR